MGSRAATRISAPWRQGTETGSGFSIRYGDLPVNSRRQPRKPERNHHDGKESKTTSTVGWLGLALETDGLLVLLRRKRKGIPLQLSNDAQGWRLVIAGATGFASADYPDLASADSFDQYTSDAGFQGIDPLTHRVIRLQHGEEATGERGT
ncbi:MAG: hypothetical protein CMJ48_08905 [Planctomycetaceae bacterium]|nr:hypothetical protein [Planctomycetaceae bacterium]